jgi:hypothetical protein
VTTVMHGVSAETNSVHLTWGVWAGTTRRERARTLRTTGSPEAAAELLEAGLPDRIARRVRAYSRNWRGGKLAYLIEPLLVARRSAS